MFRYTYYVLMLAKPLFSECVQSGRGNPIGLNHIISAGLILAAGIFLSMVFLLGEFLAKAIKICQLSLIHI